MNQGSTPTADRVLILGLDGATWDVLDPMRRRGVMPNLDALLAGSARGTLRSTIPPMTAAAWATVQTGCDPVRHGIFDHRYYDAPTGLMKVNHAGRHRVPTLWHLLDRAGRSSISLNLPGTFPAPRTRGIVVSGMDAPHLDAALAGAPAEFAEALRREVPDYSMKYDWKRVPRSLEELESNARSTVAGFLALADGGRLADRFAPDWSVLLVQFQNLDPFQHRVWRYLNVDETGLDAPDWNKAAAEVLRGLDAAIGRLCELADRRGASVLVVSDHGFGPCLGRVHVNRVLIEAGLAVLPGAKGRARRRLVQGLDHLRLWSAKRSDPEARGASFSASVRANYALDWRRTAAFAPHQDTAAMVYLNRASLRADAPLETPRQVDDARASAAQALRGATHPETGERLFPEVHDLAAEHGIDTVELGYPDLLALPDEPYWVRTKLAAGTALVEPDANLPGTHRRNGVIALRHAGVGTDASIHAELRDVTPTVLALLGEEAPDGVEGRALALLGARVDRRADAPARIGAPHFDAGFDFSAEEQALIEQRLADLGYLG